MPYEWELQFDIHRMLHVPFFGFLRRNLSCESYNTEPEPYVYDMSFTIGLGSGNLFPERTQRERSERFPYLWKCKTRISK